MGSEGRYTRMASGLADAALEHVTHAQFAPDLFYVDRATL